MRTPPAATMTGPGRGAAGPVPQAAATQTRLPGYRLRLDPDSAQIRVVSNPQVTLMWLLTAPRNARSARAPQILRHCAVRDLAGSTRAALRPFAGPTPLCKPTSLTRLDIAQDVGVRQQVERMRDTPREVIADELVEAYGPDPGTEWRPALQQPRGWLHAIADGCARAWTATEDVWNASSTLFERETRRVATAVVHGQTATLLNSLHPRLRYADGVLRFDVPTDLSFDLAGRRIGLIPMLAGPDALNIAFAMPEDVSIAYPLPGGEMSGYPGRTPPSEEDRLSLVLGPLRAVMLRRLAGPCTVGELARAANCAANTASYHCDRLQSGGLIERERRGKSVRVSRTTLGDEVVELLGG